MRNYFTSILIAPVFLVSCFGSKSATQGETMVAVMEVKEPIEGLCNQNEVYALMSFFDKGQIKSEMQISEPDFLNLVETNLRQLVDQTTNYETTANVIVNCKGKLVQAKPSKPGDMPNLDEAFAETVSKIEKWSIGTLNGQPVDNSLFVSIKIEEGVIAIK